MAADRAGAAAVAGQHLAQGGRVDRHPPAAGPAGGRPGRAAAPSPAPRAPSCRPRGRGAVRKWLVCTSPPSASGVTKPGPPGDSSTEQTTPPSASSATTVTELEADTSARGEELQRLDGPVASVEHVPAERVHRRADRRPVIAVAEDVQQHGDAGVGDADLADDAGLGQRLDAAAVGVLDRPHDPAAAPARRASPTSARPARRRRAVTSPRQATVVHSRRPASTSVRALRRRPARRVGPLPAAMPSISVAQVGIERGDPLQRLLAEARTSGRERPQPGEQLLVDVASAAWIRSRLRAAQAEAPVARRRARWNGGGATRSSASSYPCAMPALIGVDIGGTFTDVALVHDGRLTAVKLPTRRTTSRAGWSRRVARGAGGGRADGRATSATSVTARPWPPTRCSSGEAPARGSSPPPASATCWRSARQTRPHLYRPWLGRPEPVAGR